MPYPSKVLNSPKTKESLTAQSTVRDELSYLAVPPCLNRSHVPEPLILTITESPCCFTATQRWSSKGSKIKGSQHLRPFSLLFLSQSTLLFNAFHFLTIITPNLTLSTNRFFPVTFRSIFYTFYRSHTDTDHCALPSFPCGLL